MPILPYNQSVALKEAEFGCYHVQPIDRHTLQIREYGQVFCYQSEYVARLLEAIRLEEHGEFALNPKFCNCFAMTGYLVGSEEKLHWPEVGGNAAIAGKFPGEQLHDFREACRELLFPIAMVAAFGKSTVHSHSATLLAGTDPYDCVIAQKRGRSRFELCGYEEFFNYQGSPSSVIFKGKRRSAAGV